MSIIKHPTLPIERSVPESALAGWLAAGWLELLDDDQKARLADIEAAVEAESETCEASGDEPCVIAQGMATAPHAGHVTHESPAANASDSIESN